jgi:protein-tyrosine phosphatase
MKNNPHPAGQTGVLFVCLGNICRSPMAEGVFRHAVAAAGAQDLFRIDSAGTGGWHAGSPPDPRAQAALRKRGVDISGLCARQADEDDFYTFDLLLAMDADNRRDLLAIAPKGHEGKVKLFLDYAPQAPTREVPDPYYGGPGGFDHVFALVEAASQGLLQSLMKKSP